MGATASIVLALAASTVISVALGTTLGMVLGIDDALVIVLATVPVVAVASTVFFLLACLRPDRRAATAKVAVVLAILLCLAAFGLAAVNLGAEGTLSAAAPGTKVIMVLLVSCLVVVQVQWLVFRRPPPPKQISPMQFGREGANRNA